jgi:hypothetical protein
MNFGTEQKNMMLNFLFYPSPPRSYPCKKVENLIHKTTHENEFASGNLASMEPV